MSSTLDSKTCTALLGLARHAIEIYLAEGRKVEKGRDYGEIELEPRGAFVTLKTEDGELRGCIGTILPIGPLDETVVRMAIAAAVQDPRFKPVGKDELQRLRIEISALTVPEVISDISGIEVGRHGLIVSRGSRKGLLLPQVAPEWGWNKEQFLAHTCLKAGLPPEAWKDPATSIEWFEAKVWGEE